MERHVVLLNIRERRILKLLAEGCTDAAISRKMSIPESAVRKHLRNMMHKQGFVNQFQLINWAYREAIIS